MHSTDTRGAGAIHGAGAENPCSESTRKESLSLVGGAAPVPPPSMAFVLCFASLRCAPRAWPGGFSRFVPSVRCGRQGFGRFAPRFAPLRPCSLRAFARLPPPALALGGWWFWVPSRPCGRAPGAPSAASCGGEWWVSWFAGFFGGVLWLVRWLFLSLRVLCCPLVVRWPLGRVSPWVFPSARLLLPCRVSWRSAGFPLRLPPLRFPVRGRAACPPLAAAAVFALCPPPPLAFRPRGWFPFPCRRRPFPFAGVALRAPWPPCSRPAARRSRSVALGCVRGGLARRLPRPPRAGFAGCLVCGLPLAAGGVRRLSPRRLVLPARAGGRPAPAWLAGRGRPPACPAPLPGFGAAWRVRAWRRARFAGFAPPRPAALGGPAARAPRPRFAPGFLAPFLVAASRQQEKRNEES